MAAAASRLAVHEGGCHCGKLRYRLETSLSLEQLPLRACQCAFCASHGALSTSDPQGRAQLQIADPHKVSRYRFGLKLADFLICAACGVYVAAVMDQDGRRWAVINANTLDEAAALKQAPTPMSYDGESDADRTARRRSRWTPLA